jgi:hypothetical protein
MLNLRTSVLAVVLASALIAVPAVSAEAQVSMPHNSSPTPHCDNPSDARMFVKKDTVSNFWCIPRGNPGSWRPIEGDSRWTTIQIQTPVPNHGFMLLTEVGRIKDVGSDAKVRITKEEPAPVVIREPGRTDTLRITNTITEYVPSEPVTITKYVPMKPDTVTKVVEKHRSCLRSIGCDAVLAVIGTGASVLISNCVRVWCVNIIRIKLGTTSTSGTTGSSSGNRRGVSIGMAVPYFIRP